MNVKTKNYVAYYLQTAAYNISAVLSSGSVIQTYMLECGISENRVSLYVSALQIIQTVAMLLVSKATENIRDIKKAVAVSFSGYIPFFAVMIYLCGNFRIVPETKYIIIFSVSIVMSLLLGLYNIVSYKLPHIIMDMKDYGKVLGQSGVVAGLLTIAVSSLMTLSLGKYGYFSAMRIFFVVGAVMGITALLTSFAYVKTASPEAETEKVNINFFRYKPFYELIIPNFMRGFSFGMFNLITVIGYSSGLLDSSAAAVIATVTQIAMLMSCQTYSMIVKRIKNGVLIITASIVFCVVAPLTTATGSKLLFYIFYFIAYFFVNYVAYAVPVLVATHIDYKCLSQYTAWRMALYTLGIAAGGALVPVMLRIFGDTVTMLVCGISLLPCGIGYCLFEKKSKSE